MLETINSELSASARTGRESAEPKTVLLVDDHDLFREVLGIVLEYHTGFGKSVHAGSLAEACRILGSYGSQADLVIVNLDLPDGGGFALLREVRVASPGVPVLGLTVNAEHDLHARAFEEGAKEVLATSATCEDIVAAVKRQGE